MVPSTLVASSLHAPLGPTAPLQMGVPGGPELIVIVLALVLNLVVLLGFLGGLGYFLLRIRSGGSVDERLDRIERKIGRLEAQVEHLQEETE